MSRIARTAIATISAPVATAVGGVRGATYAVRQALVAESQPWRAKQNMAHIAPRTSHCRPRHVDHFVNDGVT